VNIPVWLLFAMVLALTIALTYQLVTRRFGWRIVFYWLVILAGLLGGEAGAESVGLNVARVGDVRLGPDILVAGLAASALWFLRI